MCRLNKKDLQKIFEKLDKNGDGVLSLEELNRLLEGIGVCLSIKELQASVGGNSSLDFDEFLRFYHDSIQKHTEDDEDDRELVDAFKVFDENGDGLISCDELEGVLKRLGLWDETGVKDCRNMIGVYDTNFDGFLDFQEFKNMMLQ